MKCFYHSADLDGHCSGAIVRLWAGDGCEMWPIDYGQEFPWDKITKGERVYMVDFHLQPFEDMVRLDDMCDFVWIDHHKSALEEYYRNWACKLYIVGARERGIGACALTWTHLFPARPMPTAVLRIAEYDVWSHCHPDTLPFQYGARLHETDPAGEEGLKFWDDLLHISLESRTTEPLFTYRSVLDEGKIALLYQQQLNAKYCKNAFEIDFEGHRCLALNVPFGNSMTFDTFKGLEQYDIMMPFYLRGDGKWVVSLFTQREDIDLSEIAKGKGGGGHKKAAGFITDLHGIETILAKRRATRND